MKPTTCVAILIACLSLAPSSASAQTDPFSAKGPLTVTLDPRNAGGTVVFTALDWDLEVTMPDPDRANLAPEFGTIRLTRETDEFSAPILKLLLSRSPLDVTLSRDNLTIELKLASVRSQRFAGTATGRVKRDTQGEEIELDFRAITVDSRLDGVCYDVQDNEVEGDLCGDLS